MMIQVCAFAQVDAYVTSSSISRTGDGSIHVAADMRSYGLKPGETVTVTPYLYHGLDTLELPSVEFRGRRRFMDWMRHEGRKGGDDTVTVLRASGSDEVRLSYAETVGYVDWMQRCDLGFSAVRAGCNCRQSAPAIEKRYSFVDLAGMKPELVYAVAEKGPEKNREVSGTAKVEFPVNSTRLLSDFGTNSVELQKVVDNITEITSDPDYSIKSITLTGFASPEGDYSHNEKLAQGRVDAIKDFLSSYMNGQDAQISTSYVAEDWDGVMDFIGASTLPHWADILGVIRQDIDPDAKDWRIKINWPEDYSILFKECYPSLRRTDYVIDYTIREYNELEDLKEAFRSQPAKLSLYELMELASSYETDSDEYSQVIDAAVALFPKDEVANINAANNAMRRGELKAAERYLQKAGSSPLAIYCQGVLRYLAGEYDTACSYFQKAADAGVEEAGIFLRKINIK